jgi:RND family efflux transporter MFP subunit
MQAKGTGDGIEDSKLVQNAYDDLVVSLQSVQIVLSTSLTAADNVLGIDNSFANDSFESYLSIYDYSYLNPAKSQYLVAKQIKTDFDTVANSITKNSSHTDIDKAVEKSEEAMLAMKDCLFYVSGVLDKTPPSGTLTQTALDAMKTSIQTTRTTLSTKYATIVDEAHAIITARNSYVSYQAIVNKAQSALNDAKNPPREVDIASYRAALTQAIANRDKATVRSPIDGVMTKINKKIGENVTSADIIMNVLAPNYQIKVDIPETDVSKIKVGDTTGITLDAFGNDVKFTGKITQIELASTEIQDVVYYKVTVSLDKTDKEVKPGMTANVIVKGATRQSVLYIPFRTLRTNSGKYVKVLENGKEKDVEVKIGLKADDGKVEIVEGLTEGQDVILSIKDPNAK